jgi:hypothetical protein
VSEPFKGTINIDIKDSIPDWAPYTQPLAPKGCPERLVRRARRCRVLGDGAVRRPDRDAERQTDRSSLYVRDKKVGEGAIRTQPGKFGLGGGGLVVGRSGAEPVGEYAGERPWAFVGGTIKRLFIDVSGEPFVDLATEAKVAFARQ